MFRSNAKTVLGETARFAMDATSAIDKLTLAMAEVDKATSGFIRKSARMRAALGEVSTGFGTMDAAATSASSTVVAANREMAGSFSSITRASNRATASVAKFQATAAAGSGAVASAGGSRAARAAGSVASGAGTVGGLASLALLAGGIRGAGDLQNSTLQTAIATGRMGPNLDATMRNMGPQVDLGFKMSSMTGGSVGDMMRVVQNMATSGLSEKQIGQIYRPIAQLTDILHFGKDQMDFGAAAAMSAGLAHDLRLFSAGDARHGFERIAQLGYLSPHGTNQLSTQIRRFAPQFENFLSGDKRQNADRIIETTAWLDRMGSLQFGGSGINMLATQLMNPRSSRSRGALIDMGIYDAKGNDRFMNTRTGKFDFFGALEQAAKHYEAAINLPGGRARAQADMNALPANASRILNTLASPDAAQALRNIRNQSRGMPGLEAMQTQLMETLPHAFSRLITNVNSLATVLGGPLVKPLANLFGGAAQNVSNATDYLRGHPAVAGVATAALSIGSVYGAYRLFKMVGGFAAFAHVAAHSARESMGFGAGVYMSRAGHGVAGVASRVAGMIPGVGIMGRFRGIMSVAEDLGHLGFSALRSRAGIALIGETLVKLGLRAIPVVGEVLLAIDALKLLSTHAGDIGWAVGRSARWIHDQGGPMMGRALVDAFKSMIPAVGMGLLDLPATIVGGIQNAIWQAVLGYNGDSHNPGKHGKPLKNGGGFGPTNPHDHHDRRHAYASVPPGAGGTHIHGDIVVSYAGDNLEELLHSARRHVVRGDTPDQSPSSAANTSNVTPGVHISGQG